MKTQLIGRSSLVSTRINYGCMRAPGGWDPAKITAEQQAAGRAAIATAYEVGINHFDTADIYCSGMAEKILGDALKQVSGMRQRVIITTKMGIRFPGDPKPDSPHRYDFSADHILRSCERSLRNLGIETIDLYLLHRPDMLMDPHEVAEAFGKLRLAGKVREFGVSNFKPSLVSMLQSAMPTPLVCNQLQIHPAHLDCLYDGSLDQCIEKQITPQAWSPLGGGLFGAAGKPGAEDPRREGLVKLLEVTDEIAKARGVSRQVIAIAWLLRHPAKIMPIIGTVRHEHIRDLAKADEIELSRAEWYRIFVAGRMKRLP